ncbi:CPBP family intramembrane glutamic endopeptidase [Bacteroides sedimenti]
MKKGLFEKIGGFAQLSLLALLFLFCAILCITILKLLPQFFSGMAETDILRITLLIQDLFLFILTPLIAQFLLWEESTSMTLQLRIPHFSILLWGVIAIISIIPLIDQLNSWNQSIHLPEFMSSIEKWMIDSEKAAEDTTKQLLNVNNWSDFLKNILIIAVMAGVGEELLFRGVLQKIFINWTQSIHWGILLAAIIFSTIHFQFFGFFPRVVLGMILGYLYIWSRSIWVPVISHAMNNALTVIFTPNTFNKGNHLIETISKTQNNIWYTLGGSILFAFSMWKIWTYYRRETELSIES